MNDEMFDLVDHDKLLHLDRMEISSQLIARDRQHFHHFLRYNEKNVHDIPLNEHFLSKLMKN